ncbi:MAG: pyridoxal-phosphate dependent enzyme [Chloroflexi bacterium]|nr:pyridoxal-phosphate dependent enzyme [Chloroflexota bacterium]
MAATPARPGALVAPAAAQAGAGVAVEFGPAPPREDHQRPPLAPPREYDALPARRSRRSGWRRSVTRQYKYLLEQSQIPTQWYNIAADLQNPPTPPMHPGTGQPIGPDDLAPLFPMGIILQEVSTERWIDIPEPVLDAYGMYRATPLYRAHRLEEALGTPAHIYYKYEGANPVGSHKANTAIAQAFYNREEGVKRIATETGAGQWGTALAYACQMFDIELKVYMVKVSFEQKPYRKAMMNVYGAEVVSSPTDTTEAGRQVLSDDPQTPGSLGIAISEAVVLLPYVPVIPTTKPGQRCMKRFSSVVQGTPELAKRAKNGDCLLLTAGLTTTRSVESSRASSSIPRRYLTGRSARDATDWAKSCSPAVSMTVTSPPCSTSQRVAPTPPPKRPSPQTRTLRPLMPHSIQAMLGSTQNAARDLYHKTPVDRPLVQLV